MKYYVRIRTHSRLQADTIYTIIKHELKYKETRYSDIYSIRDNNNNKNYVMYFRMTKEEIEKIKNLEILDGIGSMYYATTRKELDAIANSLYERGIIM